MLLLPGWALGELPNEWLLQALLAFGIFTAFFSIAHCHAHCWEPLSCLRGQAVPDGWWGSGSCLALSHHALTNHLIGRAVCPRVVCLWLSLFTGNWER